MPPEYQRRFSQYIAGYFPEDFHVAVEFSVGNEEALLIKIATPKGAVASWDTTQAQALDIMAMGSIAELLLARVMHS